MAIESPETRDSIAEVINARSKSEILQVFINAENARLSVPTVEDRTSLTYPHQSLKELEEKGVLIEVGEEQNGRGRPSKVYALANPSIYTALVQLQTALNATMNTREQTEEVIEEAVTVGVEEALSKV